jgi:hypothetical protein
VVFGHLLECPSDGALLGAQALVEVDAVFSFEMLPDERGVADLFAVVVDVRQLALWRLPEAAGIYAERLAPNFSSISALVTNGLGSGRPKAGPNA